MVALPVSSERYKRGILCHARKKATSFRLQKGRNKKPTTTTLRTPTRTRQADVGGYEQELADYKGKVAGFDAKNPYVQGGESFRRAPIKSSPIPQTPVRAFRLNWALPIASLADREQLSRRDSGNRRDESGSYARPRRGPGPCEPAAHPGRSWLQQGSAPGRPDGTRRVWQFREQMEAGLSGQQGGLAEGTLNTEQKAAETPSWMDEFGNEAAKGLADLATGKGTVRS